MNNEDLTKSLEKKTHKIIILNEELRLKKKNMNIFYYIFFISTAIIIIFNEYYLNYIISYISFVSSPVFYQLGLIQTIPLISFIISLAYIYLKQKEINKLFNKFEKLRIDIITQMDQKFCKHEESCNCKDEYIIKLEDLGIDVVFR